MALLPNKNLLIFNRSRPTDTPPVDFGIREIPYSSGSYNGTPITRTYGNGDRELFCAGHTFLEDGRLFIAGGHAGADGFGLPDMLTFDSGSFTRKQDMDAGGRWYPTTVFLPNRRVLTFEGSKALFGISYTHNETPTIWMDGVPGQQTTDYQATLADNDSPPPDYPPDITLFYPHMFVNPVDGSLFYTGRRYHVGSSVYENVNKRLDLVSLQWSQLYPFGAGIQNVETVYPSSAMLIKATQTGVDKAIVIKSGGGVALDTDEAAKTTLQIDLAAGSPAWAQDADMNLERKNHTLVSLPNGYVAAMGGVKNNVGGDSNKNRTAPEWRDAFGSTSANWTTLQLPNTDDQINRGYHSTSLLLPTAKVIIAGGESEQWKDVPTQRNAQIFSPPYGGRNDWESVRPTIDTAPTELRYGESFSVSASPASGASISKVVLISLGATTHSFNQTQRWVQLYWTGSSSSMTVYPPASANIAPPGYYMMFVVDDQGSGIPSEAKIVQLRDYTPVYVTNGSLGPGAEYFQSPAYATELFLAENAYLGNYIVSNAIPSNATLTIDGTAPSTDGKRIRLTIETKASRACTMALKLFNWTTSTYDTLGTVSLSANSEQKFEALSADDSDGLNNPYILSSTKKIRARFYYLDSGGSTEFNIFVDAVEFGIR